MWLFLVDGSASMFVPTFRFFFRRIANGSLPSIQTPSWAIESGRILRAAPPLHPHTHTKIMPTQSNSAKRPAEQADADGGNDSKRPKPDEEQSREPSDKATPAAPASPENSDDGAASLFAMDRGASAVAEELPACMICLDEITMDTAELAVCGHWFCGAECKEELRSQCDSCPTCRSPFKITLKKKLEQAKPAISPEKYSELLRRIDTDIKSSAQLKKIRETSRTLFRRQAAENVKHLKNLAELIDALRGGGRLGGGMFGGAPGSAAQPGSGGDPFAAFFGNSNNIFNSAPSSSFGNSGPFSAFFGAGGSSAAPHRLEVVLHGLPAHLSSLNGKQVRAEEKIAEGGGTKFKIATPTKGQLLLNPRLGLIAKQTQVLLFGVERPEGREM